MTTPREQVPEAVWRARKADDRERAQAETDWDNYLATKPVRVVRPRTIWLSDAATVLGRTEDRCPRCGFYIPVADMRDGHELRECDECRLAFEQDTT